MANWSANPRGLHGAALGYSAGYGIALIAGSAHGWGAWVEMIASTPRDMSGMGLHIGNPGATGDFEVELGRGSVGNEITLIDGLTLYSDTAHWGIQSNQPIPLHIPKGERVCMRLRSSVGGTYIRASINPWYSGGFCNGSYALAKSYGVTTTTGTAVTADATANVYGAWTEFIAAADRDICALGVSPAGIYSSSPASRSHYINIGIGSAGNEQVLVNDLNFEIHSSTDQVHPLSMPALPVQIKKGERVAIQMKCTTGNAWLKFVLRAFS